VLDDEYRNTGFCQATRAQGYSFDCEFRPHRPHLFVCTDRLQQAKSDHTCYTWPAMAFSFFGPITVIFGQTDMAAAT
jgi:hypothetical protein